MSAARDVSGEALFTSLTRPEPPESVATQLRRYVLEQGLRPGDRLPGETTLAGELGASRLTVREGLRALQALGLLEARAGSGWFLRRFDVSTAAHTMAWMLAFHPSALLDLLEVRRATEAEMVATLAGQLAEADLAVLDELVDRMRWLASRGRLFVAEDREFHTRQFAAGGNRVALALMDVYWGLLEASYRHGLPGPSPEVAPAVAESHGRIVAALRSGDGALAREVLRSSHDEAQRRFTAWASGQRERGRAGPAGGPSALEAVAQTALLGREAVAR